MSEWVLPLLAGGTAGVLSGFGVGGGTLLLVYMTAFAGLDQRLAQGINLLNFSRPPPWHCRPTGGTALWSGPSCCPPFWPVW